MEKLTNFFSGIAKSGFVRSVFMRVVSIFIIVSIAIAAIAFYSFTSEIRKNLLSDRQAQLESVEETISKRMGEITSIAYNISTDRAFYLEPVETDEHPSGEMSDTLARYLVGNNFIEHLAYYRLSEPDTIYISNGERSLREFFCTSFNLDEQTVAGYIKGIQSATRTQVIAITYGEKQNSFFAYLYPLPQLSAHPQAFVMMLIPLKEVTPLFETLLTSDGCEVAAFDADGTEIYRMGAVGSALPLAKYAHSDTRKMTEQTVNGIKYILQKTVSDSNGWTYVSAIRQSDTLPDPASKQLVLIALLLLLELLAIVAMLACIITQYRPISNLAATVAEKSADGGEADEIDERVLLSNTIATLQDDSEQKQMFETAYHEAEAASRAKSAFLSNMSHDIRTPMNAVVGMSALALHHADDPEYVRQCLKKVQVSSQYLLDIINNVLDMSRIESGRFSLSTEVIDLTTLISGLTTIIEANVEAKAQQLIVKIGQIEQPMVIGDSVRLTQIFVNILSNAVKFTPEGGTVSINMQQVPSSGTSFGDYVFTFTDTGIGMPPEFVGQVFGTFSRAKGIDVSKVEGTGLGMAIAKNLVELMGGTIRCESIQGKGTIFTVKLHMKYADVGKDKDASANLKLCHLMELETEEAVVDLSGKRILLVEDNAINREIAHQIISETKAEIEEAVDGQNALQAFQNHPAGYFDIILMDIQMPVMNGYEATAAIRALERPDAATVPIFAMTANTFDEDVRQVRDAGMNGHISKPYTPTTLYKILGRALKK